MSSTFLLAAVLLLFTPPLSTGRRVPEVKVSKLLNFTFQAPPFAITAVTCFSSSQTSNIFRTSAIAGSLGIVSLVTASSTSQKESGEFQSQQFSFSTSDIANIGSDNGIEAYWSHALVPVRFKSF